MLQIDLIVAHALSGIVAFGLAVFLAVRPGGHRWHAWLW